MSADLNTRITLRGEKDQLFAMLKVLRAFETEKYEQYRQRHNCGYIKLVEVSGNSQNCRTKSMTDSELLDFISKAGNELTVETMGPCGIFFQPEELELFEALAEAAPNGFFKGNIEGFMPGAKVGHYGELNGGLLTLFNYLELDKDNSLTNSYIKYFKKKLSRVKFCKLFKVDKSGFDMDRYHGFIENAMDYGFPVEGNSLDYDTFMGLCDSELDEVLFAEAVKSIAELEIMEFETFCESDAEGRDRFYSDPVYYDPISKEHKRQK